MMSRVFLFLFVAISLLNTNCQTQQIYRGINTRLINDIDSLQKPHAIIGEEYFKRFSEWNINVVRILFRLDPDFTRDRAGIVKEIPTKGDFNKKYYQMNFRLLDTAFKYASKYNMKLVIYTNKHIRGRKGDQFYNPDKNIGYYFELLEIYKTLAKKYKDDPVLLAYDPLSEPRREIEEFIWTDSLFEKFYNEIRKIDTAHYILFAPGLLGKCEGYKNFKPLDLEKVMYSVHGYFPSGYTHQGIKRFVKDKAGKINYPGYLQENWDTGTEYWDKTRLIKAYQPVIDFKKKYDVEIFIGEFGVVRWAPDPEVWLNDVISFYEENGFNWTYFSYGGMNRWNPTFKPNNPVSYNAMGSFNSGLIKNLKRYWSNNKLLHQKNRDNKIKTNSNIDN